MLGFDAIATLPGAFSASVSPSSASGGVLMNIYARVRLNSFTIDEVVDGGDGGGSQDPATVLQWGGQSLTWGGVPLTWG
jgi:hypothetical protein